MKTGRHFVMVGVMRPGTLINRTRNRNPAQKDFFQHENYSQSTESLIYNINNSIHCCMYDDYDGSCYSCNCNWCEAEAAVDRSMRDKTWTERFYYRGGELGLLLDLDEGTLSVYKDGRSLGVMKRGLVGHYCWVLCAHQNDQLVIKRGRIPPS